MERNYNESLLRKESSAEALVNLFTSVEKKIDLAESSLYHQFPFYRDTTGEGLIRANILFISKVYGAIIFQCIEYSEREGRVQFDEYQRHLEEIDTLIYAKFIKSELLKKGRRDLKFTITPTVFVNHDVSELDGIEYPIVTNEHTLTKLLENNNNGYVLSDTEFCEVKAVLEGSKVIPKKKERVLKDPENVRGSKGVVLSKIESVIANFDSEQKRAALFTLDSPQRIRGLAGSGKTIILAMKVALIHIQEPNAHILYTYYTKALQDYVKKLITRFYRMFSESDPDWTKIHIIHAWGGKSLEGVYYNACRYNGLPSLSLMEARWKNPQDPFSYVCEELVKNDLKIQYDYSLLDEAQDFPKAFYQLCRKITKNDRVIWAYDDFQNILNVDIQNEKETFGKNPNGDYYIDFARKDEVLQDLILHKCYRNPRKNLIAAFALGLGIYNDNGKILQRLENNDHWKSLGFDVEKGNSETGELMVVSRPYTNSPLIKNELLESNIFQIKSFSNLGEECEFIVKSILADLESELLPEDIAVISLDNKHVKTYFDYLEKLLKARGVKTFSLINAPSNNVIYKVPGHVTLSTIFKAKGNESGNIYVLGIDAVFNNKDSIIERNKLFTAITRSEAWVTLTGISPGADICIKEYETLSKNDFKLVFKQPSKESTKTIYRQIAQRQEKLNQIERIAEELKKLGLSEEELKEKLLSLIQKK